jgi:hypothetical protein
MRDTIKIYIQPAFLMCVAVLAVAGAGMSIAIKTFGVYLKKEPFPLKKSLDLLDENGLAPYKVVRKEKIENEEVVKALGTRDYIQWTLEDRDALDDSAVRNCVLFITYYELPDRVPHIPEECYTGSGYQRLSSNGIAFEVNKAGSEQKIPGKYIVFAGTNSGYGQPVDEQRFSVLYFFNVNGVYAGSREDARLTLNKNIFGRYSYFSKVEWKFFNNKFGTTIYPDEKEAVVASQKLLGVILPVLEREHWPDWEN